MLYTGVVENRDDPLKLGRCQVRIVGVHTDEKGVLPTEELPWAFPMQSVTSASMNGIGWTPVGPVPGTWVVIMFRDEENQQPIMIGTIGGIPQSKASERIIDNSDSLVTDGGVISDALGKSIKNADGTPLTIDKGVKDMMKGKPGGVIGAVANLLGINIGGFNAAADELSLPIEGGNDESKPTVIPNVQSGADAPITAQPVPGKANDKVLNTDIKVDPPAKYAPSDTSAAKEGISALIAACDQIGLTSKYAKCAILGICGGESKWLPIEEGHIYSKPESLLKVFPGVFKGDLAKATQYANWKGSKADFFREIYSPKYRNGQGAGNKLPDDGALFYGRGFNQITGRALYEQLERELLKLGVAASISKQPDLLITDVKTSALATAMFYKLNVKHPQDDPGYFQAALKRTGNPVGDSYEKKKILYEYFLGQGVIADSTNKPAADSQRTYSKDEVAHLPENKQLALLEDRSDSSTIGFRDPNGKYPLRNLLDEPDTNRLARGIIKETAIDFKDQTRTTGIEAANDGSTWEQPLAPFGGQYPYAKVYESESGHLSVFDDTPGHETLSLYHRKGTFLDIDANGTQVNKIVGDGYTIIDRNGMIYVAGKANITVGNSVNIYVMGNADIEVNGVTNANFHGDVNLGCARDVNWAIGGDLNLKIDGQFNTTVIGDINTSCDSAIDTQAKSSIYTQSDASIKTQALADLSFRAEGNQITDITGDVSLKAVGGIATQSDGAYSVKAAENIDIKSDAQTRVAAGAALHLKAGGNVNVDGVQFRGQQGSAADATPGSLEATEAFEKFQQLTLAAPELRSAAADSFEVIQTPVRPSPPIELKSDLNAANDAAIEDFKKNPGKYYDSEAAAAGVNPERSPQPNVGDAGQSLISGAETGDIAAFLSKQLALAKEGYWSETGMKGGKSNPNILAMWKDIGLEKVCGGTDQTAWCAAFINWTLKQCNYRYVQSARAFDIRDKPDRWGMTKVTTPQPGDVIVWSYSHVSFVYQVKADGNIIPCGGNQGGGKASDNNPKGGSVTVNYAGGISPSSSNIVGIYRPSKM
jgi:uncharacterized protein (TIGR02594 family)